MVELRLGYKDTSAETAHKLSAHGFAHMATHILPWGGSVGWNGPWKTAGDPKRPLRTSRDGRSFFFLLFVEQCDGYFGGPSFHNDELTRGSV